MEVTAASKYYNLTIYIEICFFIDAPEELCFNEEAVVGESFTIKCEAADGHPEPSYTIIHNNTEVVSTEKTYTIPVVNKSHAGLYKCIAENKLGKISKDYNLSVIGRPILYKVLADLLLIIYINFKFIFLTKYIIYVFKIRLLTEYGRFYQPRTNHN
jgi:hypothetical protein